MALIVNDMNPIRYSDGTQVQMGDCVETRIFLFMKRTGRVVYLPGLSQPHPKMEHDGVRRVGVKFDDGGFGGFWIEPSTSVVIKTIKFINRNSTLSESLPSSEDWDKD